MNELLAHLRADLASAGTPQNVAGAKRFFKESIDSYGVKMAETRALATEYAKGLKPLEKEALFALCDSLWQSGKMEEAHIAAFWAHSRRRQFTESDIERFETWIDRYVSNWANCDNFCNNAMGAYIEKFPAQAARLEEWTRSPNRWLRRAAAASLIAPARKGKFLPESFRIAELLLHDSDDLVQKAYGWLLKEHCKKNEAAIYDFVMAHRKSMPRTALRYAIEKMSPADRKELMV
ncbi:MAG: DNA alkylation repair protein [Chitinophagaceae bacterium]|nr:MAG: DNA alkylation repair protein [Chitinophagaceae bacterium]